MINFIYNNFLTRKVIEGKGRFKKTFRWQLNNYLNKNLANYYSKIPLEHLRVNKSSKIIVSLTSYPGRIEVVYLAIRSILYQTMSPNKVVLWLGEDKFPEGEASLPKSLIELKPYGLEIKFCEDIKAHTKYYYVFQKYPDNLILTIDDDILYPKTLISVLYKTHRRYPNAIIANRVRLIKMKKNSLKQYRSWEVIRKKVDNPSKLFFATGVSGVLYQPKFFTSSFFDKEGIRQTNCIGDDIWLKAGQVISDVPVAFTNYYFRRFIEIPDSQNENLHSVNVFNADNDRQIREVFEYFNISINYFK